MPTAHFKNEIPKKYNPQNTSRDVLKKTFTIRLKEYKKIWEDISQSKMDKPEEHYIIQGVRGSGKTTLLTRLGIAIEEDKKLSKKIITVQLKEEEYGVSTLFSFWLRIAEDLEEHYEYAQIFEGLVENIEELDSDEGAEAKTAFRLINKKLEKNKKKIILLIDNIVELFENFSDNEKAILREVLSQNANIRIIGGSAIALESFYDHKDPFYQFFKVITLKQLTKTETIQLLKTLGKVAGSEEFEKIKAVIKKEPEKIESIRRLTGGIPRTIVLLFEILADGPKGTTFQILDDTLDMASPIYKHRMDDLTKQQKPIVHAIAQHWDAISVKEIAKKTRLSSKNISAQLAQLQKQWVVESVKTDTKNNLYRLQERFFNIWYLMRYGRRQDKKKMQWLTQFLEVWCTPEELVEKARLFHKELGHNAYLPGTLHYAKAFMACPSLGVEEKEAVYGSTKDFFNKNGGGEYLKELPEVNGNEYTKQAIKHIFEREDLKAIGCLETAIDKGDYSAYMGLGLLATKMKDFERAEVIFLKAIEQGDVSNYLVLGDFYTKHIKDYEKAEAIYLKAIELGYDDAYLNLSVLYFENIKDFKRAEVTCKQAVEKNIEGSYLNLGTFYAENKEFEKAEATFLDAIKKGDDEAYLKLGILYADDIKDFKKAETAFQKAIDAGVDTAYLLLGIFYELHLVDFTKAEDTYQQAINNTSEEEAYLFLGELYAGKLDDLTRAEFVLQQAIEKNIDGGLHQLAWMYFEHKLKNKKKDAKKLASQSLERDQDFETLHTFISIALWNTELEEAEKNIYKLLKIKSWKEDEWEQKNLIDLFLLFLAKGQTNLVDRLLKEYQLSDSLRPLYFTLMHLMKNEYPNEYLRMGSEMQETVDEMLEKVKRLKKDYK